MVTARAAAKLWAVLSNCIRMTGLMQRKAQGKPAHP